MLITATMTQPTDRPQNKLGSGALEQFLTEEGGVGQVQKIKFYYVT